jgi:hypothetical protein
VSWPAQFCFHCQVWLATYRQSLLATKPPETLSQGAKAAGAWTLPLTSI